MNEQEKKELHEAMVKMEMRLGFVERALEDLVSYLEFAPVKLIVYGLVGLILSSVVAAVISIVVRK